MRRDHIDIVSLGSARRIVGKLNFHSAQLLTQTMIMTALSMLVIFLINPISQIDQISSQHHVFGQESTNVSSSSSNITSTSITFPQIHNFTSTPPAPVNSWIIESRNGVVIIDTQLYVIRSK